MFQQFYIYMSLDIQEKETVKKNLRFWPSSSPPVPQGQSNKLGGKWIYLFFLPMSYLVFLVVLNNLSSGKLLNVIVQQWLTPIYEIPQNFHCDSVSHVNVASSAATRGSFMCMFHHSFSVMVWGLWEAKHRTQSPSVLVLHKLLVKRIHWWEAVTENVPTSGAGIREFCVASHFVPPANPRENSGLVLTLFNAGVWL